MMQVKSSIEGLGILTMECLFLLCISCYSLSLKDIAKIKSLTMSLQYIIQCTVSWTLFGFYTNVFHTRIKFVEYMKLFDTNQILIGLANGLNKNGLILLRKRISLRIALVMISTQAKCQLLKNNSIFDFTYNQFTIETLYIILQILSNLG